MLLVAATPVCLAGAIDTDGYYVMDTLELSAFDGLTSGTTTLHFNGVNATITGAPNTYWLQFNGGGSKLPSGMPGATGWKLTFTNNSTQGMGLSLGVGNPTNWWQIGNGVWANAGETKTTSLNIQGISQIQNYFLIFSTPSDIGTFTFTVSGATDKSRPWNPAPADDPTGTSAVVLPQTALTWNTAMVKDPNERPNPNIRKHYVFSNLSNPSDPNLVYVGEVDAGNPAAASAQYPATGTLTLNPLTVYKWQIKEGLDNGQGGVYPYTDPNGLIAGPVWTFKTASSMPVVLQAPAYTAASPDSTVTLTANYFSLYPITAYHWYWSGDNGATFVQLSNGAHPSGNGSTVAIAINDSGSPKSTTLTITGIQGGDDGWYYCDLTNLQGTGKSENMGVAVKRLVAYYPFNGDLTDTSGEGNNGTAKRGGGLAVDLGYDTGVSGQAVVLNAATASNDPNQTYIELPMTGYPKASPGGAMEAGTILFWYKSFNWGRLMGSANNSPDTTAFTVGLDDNFDVYINGTSNVANNPSMNAVLSDNTWRFGAIRWQSGGENRVYTGYFDRNGISSAVLDAAPVTTFTTLEHPMLIGAENWRGSIGSFLKNAAIDELKIYNYPLTDAEIGDIFNANSGHGLCATGYAVAYDFDGDCIVSLSDFAVIAANWLNCGILPASACGN
jgi:hypothetical protein